MEPAWTDQAERERQARVSRRAAVRQQRLEEQYAAHPRLKELDDALRLARVSAVTDGFLSEADNPEARQKADALSAERDAYLQQAGIAPPEPDAYCAVCGDAGRLDGRPCGCLRALYAPLQRAALQREIDIGTQSFARFRLDRFRGERLEDEADAPREFMAEALDTAREYCEAFGSKPQNLLISGGVGTGKTYLSACILGALTDKAIWCEYVTAIRYLQWAEAEQFGRVYPDGRGFRRFARCDLLVLDDLGTEYLSPFAQTAFYDLVNTRLQQRRCTVITTNLTSDGLSERYLPQTASRLQGEYEMLYLTGEDQRQWTIIRC